MVVFNINICGGREQLKFFPGFYCLSSQPKLIAFFFIIIYQISIFEFRFVKIKYLKRALKVLFMFNMENIFKHLEKVFHTPTLFFPTFTFTMTLDIKCLWLFKKGKILKLQNLKRSGAHVSKSLKKSFGFSW